MYSHSFHATVFTCSPDRLLQLSPELQQHFAKAGSPAHWNWLPFGIAGTHSAAALQPFELKSQTQTGSTMAASQSLEWNPSTHLRASADGPPPQCRSTPPAGWSWSCPQWTWWCRWPPLREDPTPNSRSPLPYFLRTDVDSNLQKQTLRPSTTGTN